MSPTSLISIAVAVSFAGPEFFRFGPGTSVNPSDNEARSTVVGFERIEAGNLYSSGGWVYATRGSRQKEESHDQQPLVSDG